MMTKDTEHPERHGTVRSALTQMLIVLLGNTAPATITTDTTDRPLQLSLLTEVGWGFILLHTVQSSDQ